VALIEVGKDSSAASLRAAGEELERMASGIIYFTVSDGETMKQMMDKLANS
jgi:hypothetical protein